jgi:transcriptional regulator with XRE-family HTH domain
MRAESVEGVGFGQVLRRYRVAAGLTQEALAERAGLSARGISDLERAARTRPYPATVRRLAKALGLAEVDQQLLEMAAESAMPLDAANSKFVRWAGWRAGRAAQQLRRSRGRDCRGSALACLGALVTLLGPGGIGKTRLALEVATAMAACQTVALLHG